MNKSKIIKAQLFLFLILLSLFSKAQDSSFVPSVTYKRGFIDTRILNNWVRLSPSSVLKLYEKEHAQKSKKLYKKSRYFLPAGPPVVLGGIYLGYDAIKGTKKQTYIDGKLYTYYIRPIKELLGGLAVFAVGVCLIEYANEFKATSVDLYNEKLKNKAKSKQIDLKIGYTPSHNFGLYANF
jgi:hypothetical protein